MKYIALLRGINVGGNRKIEMSQLKVVFEQARYSKVVTYINSGNVIFEAPSQNITSLTLKVASLLESKFGFHIDTLVITKRDLLAINNAIPVSWHNNATEKTDILFLWEDSNEPNIRGNIASNPLVDDMIYVNGAVIWHTERQNYTQSGMNDLIKNPLYKKMTVRNCNTVRKLSTLLSK